MCVWLTVRKPGDVSLPLIPLPQVVELLRVLFVVCMDVSPSPVSSAAAGRSDSRNSSSKDGDSSPHFPPGTLHILSTILLVLSTDEPFMCRLHEIVTFRPPPSLPLQAWAMAHSEG